MILPGMPLMVHEFYREIKNLQHIENTFGGLDRDVQKAGDMLSFE